MLGYRAGSNPAQVTSSSKKFPIVRSVYRFGTTAMRVYNSTSVSGACREAVKGTIVDCTGGNLITVSITVNSALLNS